MTLAGSQLQARSEASHLGVQVKAAGCGPGTLRTGSHSVQAYASSGSVPPVALLKKQSWQRQVRLHTRQAWKSVLSSEVPHLRTAGRGAEGRTAELSGWRMDDLIANH